MRADKTKFPAIVTATPILLGGKIIGAVKVIHDITKEKEVDRAKSEFIALASHQLRTPSTIINWHTEALLLTQTVKKSPKLKKYVGNILDANRRMLALTDALLNVSRIELGTFVVEPVPTDIVQIAKTAIADQALEIKKAKLHLEAHYDDRVPVIPVDPNLARIIFQNLLSNAIKYTPPDGHIRLEVTAREDGDVLIGMADTGYGIPLHEQSKIFTKLFRADNIKTIHTDGNGLGLYIVKSILDQIGGRIWFESREQKGTTFFAVIPAAGIPQKAGIRPLLS